jgi:hypothetical protein
MSFSADPDKERVLRRAYMKKWRARHPGYAAKANKEYRARESERRDRRRTENLVQFALSVPRRAFRLV